MQCDITAALELLCCVGSICSVQCYVPGVGKKEMEEYMERDREQKSFTDFKEKLVWGREFSAKQECC